MSEENNEITTATKDSQPQTDSTKIHERRVVLGRMSRRGQRVTAATRKSR